MSLTHIQVVQDAENRLLDALISGDNKQIKSMLHPDVVFTDESGQTHLGLPNIPYLNPKIIKIETSLVLERNISFFTNIAIVNSIEKRTGKYREIDFEREFRITRTWKFSGRQWQVISASLVLLPENTVSCTKV